MYRKNKLDIGIDLQFAPGAVIFFIARCMWIKALQDGYLLLMETVCTKGIDGVFCVINLLFLIGKKTRGKFEKYILRFGLIPISKLIKFFSEMRVCICKIQKFFMQLHNEVI